MAKIDACDVRILGALQEDAAQSITLLAEIVGLSVNACWKRVKRLEQSGVIDRQVVLLNRDRIGLGVTVFVTIRTDQHEEQWLRDFQAALERVPEVVEFYRMSGDVDYLLKIVCSGIDHYDRIYRKLIRSMRLRDVSASFAMEQIKYTTRLPLEPQG